jgi:flotillin
MLSTQRISKLPSATCAQKRHLMGIPTELVVPAITIPTILASANFVYHRYHIARPDQYLVRTGLGINDVKISKQGLQWPFQKAIFVHMSPANHTFELHAMSSEKLEFILPGVFTIGVKDDMESIEKYVKRLINEPDISAIIKGILEGETRALAGGMTMEDIFNGRQKFKKELIAHIQEELNHFGLFIYNANVKELQDAPGSEYFKFIRQKKRSEADNTAKVDVAEADKRGNVGKKDWDAITRQEVARLEAETVLLENTRNQSIEKSKAELAVVTAEALQKTQIAQIEADKASKIRDAELQMKVEQQRIAMETEKMRASDFSKAQVSAEINMKNAEGRARAMEIEAQGKARAMEIEAGATLVKEEKRAQGIQKVFDAQSEGIKNIIASFGNDAGACMQFLMLEKDQFSKLAETNAKAIQGLNPKYTIWNTGPGTDANPIAGILKNIPPLVSTIYDQTGIKPPGWLAEMPGLEPSAKRNTDFLKLAINKE